MVINFYKIPKIKPFYSEHLLILTSIIDVINTNFKTKLQLLKFITSLWVSLKHHKLNKFKD